LRFQYLLNHFGSLGPTISVIHSHSEAANPTTMIKSDVAADTGTNDVRDGEPFRFATSRYIAMRKKETQEK
jgi:hypothetical protein